MAYRLVKEYKIYYVSNDGLLKTPEEIPSYRSWDTEEEAVDAALKNGCLGCVILPVIGRVWED